MLAANREVEHCEIADLRRKLQTDANGLNLLELQQGLLPGQPALPPEHSLSGIDFLGFHANLLSTKGDTVCTLADGRCSDPEPPFGLLPPQRPLPKYNGRSFFCFVSRIIGHSRHSRPVKFVSLERHDMAVRCRLTVKLCCRAHQTPDVVSVLQKTHLA
ncbi:hypothetical protein [Paraburkholderia sp. GAS42]|uniref:hypothetical protein n=1 Tax=Paraburkholderia sp. GAS42 TaxID=3035135 RepID=UPI003D1BC40F